VTPRGAELAPRVMTAVQQMDAVLFAATDTAAMLDLLRRFVFTA
jgi:hypothetical protein